MNRELQQNLLDKNSHRQSVLKKNEQKNGTQQVENDVHSGVTSNISREEEQELLHDMFAYDYVNNTSSKNNEKQVRMLGIDDIKESLAIYDIKLCMDCAKLLTTTEKSLLPIRSAYIPRKTMIVENGPLTLKSLALGVMNEKQDNIMAKIEDTMREDDRYEFISRKGTVAGQTLLQQFNEVINQIHEQCLQDDNEEVDQSESNFSLGVNSNKKSRKSSSDSQQKDSEYQDDNSDEQSDSQKSESQSDSD